nr:MAG: hypothetical protein J07AB56_01410 [Candidatus Nanosalinarum sp. J07AB56]
MWPNTEQQHDITVEPDSIEEYWERLFDTYDLELETGRVYGGDRIDGLDSIKDEQQGSDSEVSVFVLARSAFGEVYTDLQIKEHDGELQHLVKHKLNGENSMYSKILEGGISMAEGSDNSLGSRVYRDAGEAIVGVREQYDTLVSALGF